MRKLTGGRFEAGAVKLTSLNTRRAKAVAKACDCSLVLVNQGPGYWFMQVVCQTTGLKFERQLTFPTERGLLQLVASDCALLLREEIAGKTAQGEREVWGDFANEWIG